VFKIIFFFSSLEGCLCPTCGRHTTVMPAFPDGFFFPYASHNRQLVPPKVLLFSLFPKKNLISTIPQGLE